MNHRERNQLNELMHMLSQGDRSAFDQVYSLVWDHCHRFACTILLTDEDAKDAAQNGLLKVFSRAYQYDKGKDALAWIFTIVAFECKTITKRRLRRKETEANPDHFCPDNGTEDSIIRERMRNLAFTLIRELKPADQNTIKAVLNEDGPKSSLLRKRFERAVRRFKTAWEKKYGEKDSQFKI